MQNLSRFSNKKKQTRHKISKKKKTLDENSAKISKNKPTHLVKICQYFFFSITRIIVLLKSPFSDFTFGTFFQTNKLKPVTLLRVIFCTGLARYRENVLWRIKERKARVTEYDVIITLEGSSRLSLCVAIGYRDVF